MQKPQPLIKKLPPQRLALVDETRNIAPAAKRAIAEVVFGEFRGTRRIIEPGATLRVGRTEEADFVITHDRYLSGVHFALDWDGRRCRLRDLGSATGVQLSGEAVQVAEVAHGDWIRAGETDLMVFFEDHTPPSEPDDEVLEAEQVATLRDRSYDSLSQHVDRLFGVLDATRGNRVVALLREHVDTFRCLYEGPEAETLAEAAPFLVQFRRDSRLLQRVVNEGWGQRWGIFLIANKRLDDVRRHLRRFLITNDDTGGQMYFRYYDPVVLQDVMKTITPRQKGQLFAEIDAFIVEDRSRGLLVFEGQQTVEQIHTHALAASGEVSS